MMSRRCSLNWIYLLGWMFLQSGQMAYGLFSGADFQKMGLSFLLQAFLWTSAPLFFLWGLSRLLRMFFPSQNWLVLTLNSLGILLVLLGGLEIGLAFYYSFCVPFNQANPEPNLIFIFYPIHQTLIGGMFLGVFALVAFFLKSREVNRF